MGREHVRQTDEEESSVNTSRDSNVLTFTDEEEARARVLQRVENDSEDLVDVNTSDSFEFAQSLRSDFEDYRD